MLETLLSLGLGILITLVIIAACAFFVAQEFAYMSVDRVRMAALAEKGDVGAQRVLKITKRTSFMLSGAQLGITVTGLMIGYVAEPMIGVALAELLGVTGISMAISLSIGTVFALVAATVITMIFGELYPKNLAIAAPEALARALAVPTQIYLMLFGWLIKIFDLAANALLKLLRIEPLEDVDESATARDLEAIVEDSRASGDLSDELSVIIDRILDFPEQDVEHAMVSRSKIDSVSPEMTVGEIRELMAGGHTRYPVVGDEDEPLGVVELIDVLRFTGSLSAPISVVMREAVVLPTTMKLPTALEKMRNSRNELACVVDEYGNFDGILTLEDLTEEVIGEISDEHDVVVMEVESVGASKWRIPGDLHLDEVERLIGFDLETEETETIAGLIIHEHDDLMPVGTVVRIDLPEEVSETVQGVHIDRWLEVEVTEVARLVPSQLVVTLHEIDREVGDAAEEVDASVSGGEER